MARGVIRFTDLGTWKPSGATVEAPPAGHLAGDDLLPGRADARRGHGRGPSLGAAPDRRRDATGQADRLLAGVRYRQAHPEDVARLRARRPPRRRRPGEVLGRHPAAGGAASAAPRRPDRTRRMAAPLSGPARPAGGPRPLRPRRRADHVRRAGRHDRVERAHRPDPSPLPDRWTTRALARRPHARARPQQHPGRPTERLGRRARPAHRPPAGVGARPGRGVDHEPGLLA